MDYDLAIIGAGPAGLSFDTPANDTDALGFLISNFRIRKATFEEFDTLENVTLIDDSEVRGVAAGDYGATVTLVSGEKIQVSMIVAADTRFSASHR